MSSSFRHDFEGEGVIGVADGTPEGDGGGVRGEGFHVEAFVFRPMVINEKPHGGSANALAAVGAGDEELAEVDFFFSRAVKGVGDGLGI